MPEICCACHIVTFNSWALDSHLLGHNLSSKTWCRKHENTSQLFATRKKGRTDFGKTEKRHHLCSAIEAAVHPVPAEVSRNETFEADSIRIFVKGSHLNWTLSKHKILKKYQKVSKSINHVTSSLTRSQLLSFELLTVAGQSPTPSLDSDLYQLQTETIQTMRKNIPLLDFFLAFFKTPQHCFSACGCVHGTWVLKKRGQKMLRSCFEENIKSPRSPRVLVLGFYAKLIDADVDY